MTTALVLHVLKVRQNHVSVGGEVTALAIRHHWRGSSTARGLVKRRFGAVECRARSFAIHFAFCFSGGAKSPTLAPQHNPHSASP
jgi:hypothetical protein